jgi:hypothetical protein
VDGELEDGGEMSDLYSYQAAMPDGRNSSIEEAVRQFDQSTLRRDMERAVQRLNQEVDELREIVLQLIDVIADRK